MPKKTKEIILSRYPRYRPLPWELDKAREYAEKSTEKFKNNGDKRRDYDKKLHDAYIGILGETAFYEMLKPEKKEFIKEWTAEAGKMGKDYDFLVGLHNPWKTFDIKTSERSDIVISPEACNFAISINYFAIKEKRTIPLCDYYIQMYWDDNTESAYFIGALSKGEIEKYVSKEKRWYKSPPGIGVIEQSAMDFTEPFLLYFDEKYRTYQNEYGSN